MGLVPWTNNALQRIVLTLKSYGLEALRSLWVPWTKNASHLIVLTLEGYGLEALVSFWVPGARSGSQRIVANPKQSLGLVSQSQLFLKKYMVWHHKTNDSEGNARFGITKPIILKIYKVLVCKTNYF